MSTFTRVATALVIPDRWFETRPNVVSKSADAVVSWCDICGTLEPRVCANGYMRKQCEHQRLSRAHAASPQSTAIGTRCYTWLSNQAGDLESKTFENFKYWMQVQDAEAFKRHLADAKLYAGKIALKQAAGNLLMKGDYGVGKTHLAAAILNRLRAGEEPIGGLFCTVQDFFDMLYTSDFDKQFSLMAQASSTPVLVLDDLDKLYTKADGDYQKKKLFSIINRRYLAKLPTIITTNAQDDLSRWLDDPTISRLRERMTTLSMHGVDYRRPRGNG